MNSFYLILLFPIFGVFLMLLCGNLRSAGYINIGISVLNFISSIFVVNYFLQHGPFLALKQQFYIDAFNLWLIVLTTFIVMTTAIFSNTFMWNNTINRKINIKHLRLYHTMYQLFVLMMLIALSANNLGILWVAIEGATLATVLLVSLYRTKESIEASWKYFILCIVGIALALFGTVLIYFSAASYQAQTNMLWSVLIKYAQHFNPAIVRLAFVFLLVGYGTKIGLVPMHNWLPDTYSQSPAPVSILLSGLLSNVALYALLRFKVLVDLTLANNLTGKLMMIFGLLSFMVAVIFMQKQSNIKRLFSYSSIEHMGLITFSFGLGSSLANFVGIFYMLVHSLTKSAIFAILGSVVQQTATSSLDKIKGLISGAPQLGWSLLLSTLVICGIPPFGVFISEFFIFIICVKTIPILTIVLLVGFLMGLSGLMRNIQPIVYGSSEQISRRGETTKICLYPAIIHLIIVLTLGVYLPPILYKLLQQAAAVING